MFAWTWTLLVKFEIIRREPLPCWEFTTELFRYRTLIETDCRSTWISDWLFVLIRSYHLRYEQIGIIWTSWCFIYRFTSLILTLLSTESLIEVLFHDAKYRLPLLLLSRCFFCNIIIIIRILKVVCTGALNVTTSSYCIIHLSLFWIGVSADIFSGINIVFQYLHRVYLWFGVDLIGILIWRFMTSFEA